MALIGKSNRQSVLEEDAAIYQAEEKKSEKKKWSEMDNRQRLAYFADYYLLKCVVVALACVAVVYMAWTVLKPKKEQIVSMAVVRHTLVPEEKDRWEQQLAELLQIDPGKEEIHIDDSFSDSYESEMKLQAYVMSQEMDLLITDEEQFKQYAQNGFFVDLSEFVPDFCAQNEESLFWTDGYVEDGSDTKSDGSEANHADSKPYGIRVTDCKDFKNAWQEDTEAVLGVIQNSNRQENAKTVLLHLFR